MPNRDGLPRRRGVTEVFADRIVKSNPALRAQPHDTSGDELLADRADLVDRLRRRAGAELQVGNAIAPHLHRLAVLQDGQGQARDVLPVHLRRDVVIDLVGAGATARRRPDDQGQPDASE
jgi:hypothetical protein